MKQPDLTSVTPLATHRSRQSGLTLTEVIGGIFLVVLLVTVGYKMYSNQKEKEELLNCMAEMRGVHASILEMSARGSFASAGELWEMNSPGGTGDGIFCYVTGSPETATTSQPAGQRSDDKLSFVLFCQHDHGSIGKYVYLNERGQARVATEDHDPDYRRYARQETGGAGTSLDELD